MDARGIKMNVLFVTREYPPFVVGGVAVHTFHLVKNLEKLGVSCRVLSFGDEKCSSEKVTFVKPSSSIIERSNVSLALDVKIPSDIVRFSKITNRILKNKQFDVVHVEEPYVGAFITPRHNQVKVSTFHDTSFGEIKAMMGHSFSVSSLKRTFFYSSLGLYLEFICIASSNALIVPTPQVKDELSKVYRTSIEKVKIIQNGVELPELNKLIDGINAKQKLGLSPETILIFSVARLVSRKRLDLLVKAIKILQSEKITKYHVIIAGEGPDRSNVVSLVKKYGLEHIIELPGWISDQQRDLYYRAADIFVLTSDYEGFPFTMLEAMSYGAAIINSRITSLSPLRDGLDGLLFPPGDFRALSVCIRTLSNNPSLRMQLSTSARRFAEKNSWKKIAEKTINVYENLVQSTV
jgi:glycosyltransferase involved in cell wall biosynthesis